MKVSVCMITYNHEPFIAQAIESVMMQQADFACELVIGEDCSTDRTRDLVVEYAERYPDRIRPLLRERNLGMHPNFVQTLQHCRGEYVALLEGDDYWTDPLKLQKQADYLDSHPASALCFHPVRLTHLSGSEKGKTNWPPGRKPFYVLSDILAAKYLWIHTSSILVRNHQIDGFPTWFYSMPMGDLPFIIMNAQKGDMGYLDEVMGCYRIHPNGTWSQADEHLDIERTIAAREILVRNLDQTFTKPLSKTLSLLYLDFLRSCLSRGDHRRARSIAALGLRGYRLLEQKSLGGLARLVLQIYTPRLYDYLANR